jgi:hypothetical protein
MYVKIWSKRFVKVKLTLNSKDLDFNSIILGQVLS